MICDDLLRIRGGFRYDYLFTEDRMVRVRLFPSTVYLGFLPTLAYILVLPNFPQLFPTTVTLPNIVLVIVIVIAPFFGYALMLAILSESVSKRARQISLEMLGESGRRTEIIPYSELTRVRFHGGLDRKVDLWTRSKKFVIQMDIVGKDRKDFDQLKKLFRQTMGEETINRLFTAS